jgi:catechol 2,3-dioxygenase-like lactoylglutathione lyase family enzyme
VQSALSHMQVNIRPANMPFYKDLATFLGWKTLYDSAEMLGVAGTNDASLWFAAEAKDANNDYDGPGVNHLGIGVDAQADVDTAAAWLKERGVELLFETPRHRPEFSSGEGQTYYQVMFESPDRILFEVVYTGPKSA